MRKNPEFLADYNNLMLKTAQFSKGPWFDRHLQHVGLKHARGDTARSPGTRSRNPCHQHPS